MLPPPTPQKSPRPFSDVCSIFLFFRLSVSVTFYLGRTKNKKQSHKTPENKTPKASTRLSLRRGHELMSDKKPSLIHPQPTLFGAVGGEPSPISLSAKTDSISSAGSARAPPPRCRFWCFRWPPLLSRPAERIMVSFGRAAPALK